MPQSEAQRRATAKYNKEHYTTLSVRVSIQEAAAIRSACAAAGTTPSTVARSALLALVQQQHVAAPATDPGDSTTTPGDSSTNTQ